VEKIQDHINLGVAFSLSRRYQDAIREFQKALALNPKDAEVHFQLGILYSNVGE
jgi:Flp pilus assembly protein TadD